MTLSTAGPPIICAKYDNAVVELGTNSPYIKDKNKFHRRIMHMLAALDFTKIRSLSLESMDCLFFFSKSWVLACFCSGSVVWPPSSM